ncbi:MAG: PadR family transcriptional regulator [Anaerovoracaceae bacterium]
MKIPIASALLDACVLGVLSKGDTYGYDLTQKIQKTTELSESTLYPVLRRLLKEGFLISYDEPYEGRNRRYYKITEIGEIVLAERQIEWKEHKRIVDKLIKGSV